MCCPAALGHQCLAPSPDGTCPLPDLAIAHERVAASARVVWQEFDAGDCAIVEGCVGAPGWRRLLRFETFTPNHGSGDLRLGTPTESSPNFVWSDCHGHFHFDGYADYRLLDARGAEIGAGHKQAFCLLDTERVEADPTVRARPRYTCVDQGISRGWGDSYGAELDCQWVDITDVTPGEYTLRVAINEERSIPEISYEDNVADIPVSIPPTDPDPTDACAGPLDGPRDCGWTLGETLACTPGVDSTVGCGNACGLGTCTGDPMLRICPGVGPCDSRRAIAGADGGCGGRFAACPITTFVCPSEGRFTILTAPALSSSTAAMCVPAAR